jgi:hypothetical protein
MEEQMAKMNPEVKARWVAALRSGEYEQATGQLRKTTGSFCCLGVLCNLYDSAAWGKEFDGYDGVPSNTVLDWAGLDSQHFNSAVRVDIGGVVLTLYEHNDKGRTFAEIADAIEAQL